MAANPKSNQLISIENLLKNSWSLYQKSWPNLFFISLITVAAWKIWGILVMPAILAIFGLGALATHNLSLGLGVGLVGLAVLILSWVVVFEIGFWGSAAGVMVLKTRSEGQNQQLGNIYGEAKKLLWPLSIVSLLVFLTVVVGLIFLIIPGLILAFLLQFTNFVVVTEGKTGFSVLERSIKLVRGNFLGILGRSIILLLLIGLINIFFGRVLLFSVISQVIILPFALAYYYLIYKDVASRS